MSRHNQERTWFGSPFGLSLWPTIFFGWIGCIYSSVKAHERGLSFARYIWTTVVLAILATVMLITVFVVALATPEILIAPVSDTVFLTSVRQYDYPASDEQLISIAHNICDSFESGTTWESVGFNLMNTYNLGPTESGHLIGTSVGSYCLEYTTYLQTSTG